MSCTTVARKQCQSQTCGEPQCAHPPNHQGPSLKPPGPSYWSAAAWGAAYAPMSVFCVFLSWLAFQTWPGATWVARCSWSVSALHQPAFKRVHNTCGRAPPGRQRARARPGYVPNVLMRTQSEKRRVDWLGSMAGALPCGPHLEAEEGRHQVVAEQRQERRHRHLEHVQAVLVVRCQALGGYAVARGPHVCPKRLLQPQWAAPPAARELVRCR